MSKRLSPAEKEAHQECYDYRPVLNYYYEQGGYDMSPFLLRRLYGEHVRPHQPRQELSDLQLWTLQQLISGQSSRAIAKATSRSEDTLRSRRISLYKGAIPPKLFDPATNKVPQIRMYAARLAPAVGLVAIGPPSDEALASLSIHEIAALNLCSAGKSKGWIEQAMQCSSVGQILLSSYRALDVHTGERAIAACYEQGIFQDVAQPQVPAEIFAAAGLPVR